MKKSKKTFSKQKKKDRKNLAYNSSGDCQCVHGVPSGETDTPAPETLAETCTRGIGDYLDEQQH